MHVHESPNAVFRGLRCFALLVLTIVAQGVALSKDAKLQPVGQLSTEAKHPASSSIHHGVQKASRLPRPHHQPIVALQSEQQTHLRKAGAKAHRANARVGARAKRARRSKLHRMIEAQNKMSRRHTKIVQKLGVCRGMKLKWWIKIKKKCTKAYGESSKWDRNRLDGQCSTAWNQCNTGFYAVCCTQPLGPKNLGAYCDKQNMTVAEDADGDGEKDKACEVQGTVAGVQDKISEIKDTIKDMDKEKVEEEAQEQAVVILTPGAPSPGPAMAPAVAPSGLTGSLATTTILAPPGPSPMEKKCETLERLTKEVQDKIKNIKLWAKKDGIKQKREPTHNKRTGPQEVEDTIEEGVDRSHPDDAEAKDPDLVFSVQDVLAMGEKLDELQKKGKFCNKGVEDDDDSDNDPVERDLQEDPTKKWVSDDDEDDEEEYDLDPVTKVNDTLVLELLEWETEMDSAVTNFETGIHPHGYKWWRYRYEYTVIESFVLAFSILFLYLVMWLASGTRFFQTHQFYKTGRTSSIYKYAWMFLVFHSAILMFMVFTAYMLYIPWGKNNLFNMFAKAFHDYIDGRANVPILGYSWLYMILDVQFQLYATFVLYTIFLIFIIRNYVEALTDWKELGLLTPQELRDSNAGSKTNNEFYKHLVSIIDKRVRATPSLQALFVSHKLRLPGGDVHGDPQDHKWADFGLHLLLTEAVGRSMEHLLSVSLTTHVVLAISTLLVAALAHHYQVAFMYFLPPFILVSFLVFVFGYAISVYFRKMSDNLDHKTPSKYVTVHSYCRMIQVLMYVVFFSFARLLLSNDIYEFYAFIYISALIGLIVMMILLAVFAGEVIKQTVCCMVLPPHIPEKQLGNFMEHIADWHTKYSCHECGARQQSHKESYSRDWAGATQPKCSNELCDAYFFDHGKFCRKCGAPRPALPSLSARADFGAKSFRPM